MTNAYAKSRIRKIVRRFGLIPLRSDPIASFYRKSAIVRVLTGSGIYAMKPFFRSNLLRSGTIDQIKTTADHVQLLMNNGFNSMPKWLASNSGKLWTLDQGRPFYLTTWINGRSMENQEDFEKLGRVLASLHTSSRSLPIKGHFYDHIRLWQNRDRLFRKRMAKANQSNRWTRRWYKRLGESCTQFSDRSWTELKSPEIVDLLEKEMIRPALIHSDITSQNVIIANDGQLFIIDWDRMKLGSIYVDVATALMNTTRFNPVFIHSLLKGYEELCPLDRTERRMISSLYRFPREAWSTVQFPSRPRSHNILDIMEKTWLLRLKAMDLLDEWVNQQKEE
ncbi:aminoglycoside phosphotransferase family protein [Paenibacillus ginsengarvi]|uniref:Aminoglycoside phosphotransferase family protein n=1 Tax=Paenibacillus ginsengarvi TaxID=400777 RepID=A0A3B0BEX5_9BACL|nr:aminoglycoside phosphotransferase family protein [Paenibacillus ginsengarvi]RKN70566.1 aminoglycoside phosphotransferase family protein [Paenibacillus ginsengarvi]